MKSNVRGSRRHRYKGAPAPPKGCLLEAFEYIKRTIKPSLGGAGRAKHLNKIKIYLKTKQNFSLRLQLAFEKLALLLGFIPSLQRKAP